MHRSVLPSHLELNNSDSSTLNAMVTPQAPSVQLVRRIWHNKTQDMNGLTIVVEGNNGVSRLMPLVKLCPPSPLILGENGGLKVILQEVAIAAWWAPPQDTRKDLYVRAWRGNTLTPDLEPSSACTISHIEVCIRTSRLWTS